jgi:hypothetical protein
MPPLYFDSANSDGLEIPRLPQILQNGREKFQIPLQQSEDQIIEVIRSIREDPPPTALMEGCLYATQDKNHGFVKVGWTGLDGGERFKSITKCKLKVGRIFQTKPFKWAFKAERIVQQMLSEWNIPLRCCTCKKTHKELYRCSFGHVISTIDLVRSWICEADPYEEAAGKIAQLKKDWGKALNRFQQSQKTEHHMEWIEFFRLELKYQIFSHPEDIPPEIPKYLSYGEVEIFGGDTMRFWLDRKQRESTPQKSVDRQTGTPEIQSPLHPGSAPARLTSYPDRDLPTQINHPEPQRNCASWLRTLRNPDSAWKPTDEDSEEDHDVKVDVKAEEEVGAGKSATTTAPPHVDAQLTDLTENLNDLSTGGTKRVLRPRRPEIKVTQSAETAKEAAARLDIPPQNLRHMRRKSAPDPPISDRVLRLRRGQM